ncbi:MAG: calcium/sodium antiporter [Clostridia bacterium]|nr:calcium/sodium antiporter [Clostridia bacterium]
MTFWTVLLFLLGFACLIFGGNWFVDAATGLARRMRMSEIVIGATIVSIGTTLPEVMVSSTSAVMGHGEIAYGNAVGSIICNAALIAALTITIRPSNVSRKSILVPAISFFVSAAVFCASAYWLGGFPRWIGIILLLILVQHMFLTLYRAKKEPEQPQEETAEPDKKPSPLWKDILFLIVGAALIAVGARLLVDNGTVIAQSAGVPESVIALTMVALGTSLPELVTAIVALIKGHSALSLGNIIGANILNIVFVTGLSATISPFSVPSEKMLFGQNASLVLDIPLMLALMLILTLPAIIKQKLYRTQGIVMLVAYVAFCTFQFVF